MKIWNHEIAGCPYRSLFVTVSVYGLFLFLTYKIYTNSLELGTLPRPDIIFLSVLILSGVNSIILLLFFHLKCRFRKISNRNTQLRENIQKNQTYIHTGKKTNMVVHNIKSKMLPISGVASYLENSEDPYLQKLGSMQQEVVSQISGLVSSINDPIKYSHIFTRQPVSVSSIVQKQISFFQLDPAYRQRITFHTRFGNNDTAFVYPNKLIQIIDNLLINAVEATEGKKGEIQVTTERTHYFIHLVVHDNGKGIPACSACRRKKESCLTCNQFEIGKTGKLNGTGIGLVFVQETVKKIKGILHIQSQIHTGTKITILLPILTTS